MKPEGRGTGTLTRDPNKGKFGRPLKTPADVERIKFSTDRGGRPIKIGGHSFGDVFVGRIHFKGEHTTRRIKGKEKKQRKFHRVAIKRFHDPMIKEFGGDTYQDTIHELRSKRVAIPKMGMVLLPKGFKIGHETLDREEWVQVSQLYGGSKKGSKIENKSWGKFPNEESREFAVRELMKVANAGREPRLDLIEPIRLKDSEHVIPFDIDELSTTYDGQSRAGFILEVLGIMASKPYVHIEDPMQREDSVRKEFSRLYGIAQEDATPAMRRRLEKTHRENLRKRELGCY